MDHPEEYYLRAFIHYLKMHFQDLGAKRLSGFQVKDEIVRLEIEYEHERIASRALARQE